MTDSFVTDVRARITEADERILDAVNDRLELVASIRAYKEANGLPLIDAAREESLIKALADRNAGPLSEEGVAELFTFVLDLVKREVF